MSQRFTDDDCKCNYRLMPSRSSLFISSLHIVRRVAFSSSFSVTCKTKEHIAKIMIHIPLLGCTCYVCFVLASFACSLSLKLFRLAEQDGQVYKCGRWYAT